MSVGDLITIETVDSMLGVRQADQEVIELTVDVDDAGEGYHTTLNKQQAAQLARLLLQFADS